MGDAYAPFATADAATSLDLDDLEKARSRLSIWNAFARMWGGDPEGAQPAFAESVTVGQRFNDIDLLTMSRLAQGMCLIMRGHGPARIALLDELMVGVTSGEVSPMYAGIAYCTVIAGCSDLFDLRRAREWTAARRPGRCCSRKETRDRRCRGSASPDRRGAGWTLRTRPRASGC
jgi:hypothetical protein